MNMENILNQIKKILGDKGWSDDNAVIEPWLIDSRNRHISKPAIFIQPKNIEQIAAIVKICHQNNFNIVTQGGNTGRCGGAATDDSGNDILLNMARMNKIRDIDADNFTMTVEAGCILGNIQNKAIEIDRIFPLSLGAEGSCMIGGNIATNAGGINVLRYGNCRDLILGIEAVLPDGRIWNGLRRLHKDNTGYDLKQLFIGSEGTIGIITACVLKLFPRPVKISTAFCALSDLSTAIKLLAKARIKSGDSLNSFELIPAIAIDTANKYIADIKKPFDETPKWAILCEFASSTYNNDIDENMQNMLEDAFENNIITDAIIAKSGKDSADFWRLREAIVTAQQYLGASIKHDISVPISMVENFINAAGIAVENICPDIRPYSFGHLGDGNIHYNLSRPSNMSDDNFMAMEDEIHRAVHDITDGLGGSFSAEHGIGLIKTMDIERYKSDIELELMQAIKGVFDPKHIMNHGKLLPIVK